MPPRSKTPRDITRIRLQKEIDVTLKTLKKLKAKPPTTFQEAQQQYGQLVEAHRKHSNWLYHNDQPDCGFNQVEEHLKKLRAYLYGRTKDDHLHLSVAYAIRDAFENPDWEQAGDRVFHDAFTNHGIEAVWYPFMLASHWSNDLVDWADTVLSGKWSIYNDFSTKAETSKE